MTTTRVVIREVRQSYYNAKYLLSAYYGRNRRENACHLDNCANYVFSPLLTASLCKCSELKTQFFYYWPSRGCARLLDADN